ncbi:hypothetical protein CK203_011380 [Vitis vinifera]|uniref:Uncharacterized protein n=1 Tax=Vitis vinifera TaxID=29760 RepID=A0A438JYH4_VITVI|nr:hypothetical protein CK203_011380 [Vitis vinifera]
MIGVVCMIMDPFGCWESVGKQLKLRNLLNYIMKWDGLLHDSGEGDPPCVLLCFEQTLVASQRQILAEFLKDFEITVGLFFLFLSKGIRLLVLRSAQKNHDRLGILISNINMSSWYLLTEKDFSPRQQNLVFPQVAFLLSFIIIICGFRLEGDNLGT